MNRQLSHDLYLRREWASPEKTLYSVAVQCGAVPYPRTGVRATIWRAQSRRGESPAAIPPTPLLGKSVATAAHLGHSPAALITRLRLISLPGLTCPTPSRGAGAEQVLALACLAMHFSSSLRRAGHALYIPPTAQMTSVVAASVPRRPVWAAVINSVCCPKLQCAIRMR